MAFFNAFFQIKKTRNTFQSLTIHKVLLNANIKIVIQHIIISKISDIKISFILILAKPLSGSNVARNDTILTIITIIIEVYKTEE